MTLLSQQKILLKNLILLDQNVTKQHQLLTPVSTTTTTTPATVTTTTTTNTATTAVAAVITDTDLGYGWNS
jgi:hypothetical protein